MTITQRSVSSDGMWVWYVIITDLCVWLHTGWAKFLQRDGGAGVQIAVREVMRELGKAWAPLTLRNVTTLEEWRPYTMQHIGLWPGSCLIRVQTRICFLFPFSTVLQHPILIRSFYFFWLISISHSVSCCVYFLSPLSNREATSGSKQMSCDDVGVSDLSWQGHTIPNDQDTHYIGILWLPDTAACGIHSFQPDGMHFTHGSKIRLHFN